MDGYLLTNRVRSCGVCAVCLVAKVVLLPGVFSVYKSFTKPFKFSSEFNNICINYSFLLKNVCFLLGLSRYGRSPAPIFFNGVSEQACRNQA